MLYLTDNSYFILIILLIFIHIDSTSLKLPIDDDCVSCSDLPPVPDDLHIPMTPNFIPTNDEEILPHTMLVQCTPKKMTKQEVNIDDKIEIITEIDSVALPDDTDDHHCISSTNTSQSNVSPTEDRNLPNEYRADSPPSLVFSSSAAIDTYDCDPKYYDDNDPVLADDDNMYSSLPSLKLDFLPSSASDSDKIVCPSKSGLDNVVDDDAPNHITDDSSCSLTSSPPLSDDYDNDDQFPLPPPPPVKLPPEHRINNLETELVANEIDRKLDYESTQPSPQDDELDTSFGDFSEFTVGEVQVPDDATLNCDSSKMMTIDADFTADFSQFDAISSSGGNNVAVAVVDAADDGEDGQQATCRDFDDDDEFDDFATFDDTKVQTTDISETLAVPKYDDDDDLGDGDDDDFGDFSDFTQSQSAAVPAPPPPIVPNLTVDNVSGKIGSVLDMMFPVGDEVIVDAEMLAKELDSGTTCQLKDFDNSKASEHLWASSVGKNALVTALGIDLRNIVSWFLWPL